MRETPIGIGQHRPNGRAGRADHRAEAGSAAPRAAHLRVPPAIQGAQAVRMRDTSATTPAEPRQPARIGPAQAPNGALPRPAGDAHTGRHRPQSQGGSQPPCHNAQALDVARNPVTVAGRRCRASGRVRPRWDQAFPCYSPLTGWASGPVAASRPSGEHPPAGGPALHGSTVRWYPSPTWGHGHGASGECSRHGGPAHDGALAASPKLCLRPKVEVRPCCTASDQAHRDWGRVHPERFRPMDWLVAPRLARKAQARQSPQRRSRDALFSSVASDDDYFGRPLVGAVHTSDQRPRQPRPAHGKSETARSAGRRNRS